MAASGATCIRNASWIVAWDAAAGEHVYLRDQDIAWQADRIVQVGGRFEGPVETEVSGRGRLIMPGMIDIHCHPTQTPIFRGFVEEFGNPRLFYGGRIKFRQSYFQDDEAFRASARYGLAEMLAGGITTIVDLSHAYPGWLDILDESGIRACVAPMFRSARWWTDTGQEIKYDMAPDEGRAAFEEARAVMDEAERHPNGRLSAMVAPAQADTCTPDLLRAAAALSSETGRPLFTHAAQNYPELLNMARWHNMTTIGYLHSIGFLTERTVLAHVVFTDEHPWMKTADRRDLRLLAESGTSVAHCPTVFWRDATMMYNLGAYMDAGINVAIGTDTHPQNMFEEMRIAECLARVAAGPRHTLSTTRLFHAATIGAAKILGRDDIGRLAPGAKADLVTFDLARPEMHPMRDPLRNLIYSAAERAVLDVYVDGRQVVANGEVLTIDWPAAAETLSAEQERIGRTLPDLDAIAPRSLRLVN